MSNNGDGIGQVCMCSVYGLNPLQCNLSIGLYRELVLIMGGLIRPVSLFRVARVMV